MKKEASALGFLPAQNGPVTAQSGCRFWEVAVFVIKAEQIPFSCVS